MRLQISRIMTRFGLRLPLVARALGYHDPPKAVERHVDNYFMVQINEQPQRVGRFIHHFKRAAT